MDLVIIRHAQPAWTETGISPSDPDLTDLGRRQAAATADRLSDDSPFHELLVSPAVRARSTAAPAADRLGLTPTIVEGLVEVGMADPPQPAPETTREGEGWDRQHRGERFDVFQERVSKAFGEVLSSRGIGPGPRRGTWSLAAARRGRILIVAHGGTNAVIIAHLLGLDPIPREWERFVLPHASIVRFSLHETGDGHVFGMHALAEVGHLGEVGVTT